MELIEINDARATSCAHTSRTRWIAAGAGIAFLALAVACGSTPGPSDPLGGEQHGGLVDAPAMGKATDGPTVGEYRIPAGARRIVVELIGGGGGGAGGGGGRSGRINFDYASGGGGGGGAAGSSYTCQLDVRPGQVYQWRVGEGGVGGAPGLGARTTDAAPGGPGRHGGDTSFTLIREHDREVINGQRCIATGGGGGYSGIGGTHGKFSAGGTGGSPSQSRSDGAPAGGHGQQLGGGGGGNGSRGTERRDESRAGKDGGSGSHGHGGSGGVRGNTVHEDGSEEVVCPTGGGGGGGAIAVTGQSGAAGGPGGRPFQEKGLDGSPAVGTGAGGGGGGGAGGNGSAALTGGRGGAGESGGIKWRVYRR